MCSSFFIYGNEIYYTNSTMKCLKPQKKVLYVLDTHFEEEECNFMITFMVDVRANKFLDFQLNSLSHRMSLSLAGNSKKTPMLVAVVLNSLPNAMCVHVVGEAFIWDKNRCKMKFYDEDHTRNGSLCDCRDFYGCKFWCEIFNYSRFDKAVNWIIFQHKVVQLKNMCKSTTCTEFR